MKRVSGPRSFVLRRPAVGALYSALLACAGPAAGETPPLPEQRSVGPPAQMQAASVDSSIPGAPASVDPLAPADPRDAKVFAVLNRHCARCHDARRLTRLLPASGVGNILDLEGLARRRDLVRPGHPDGSPLYVAMQTRHMPFDVFQKLQPGDEPTPEEIAAVRSWIEDLPKQNNCKGEPVTAGRELARLVDEDLRRLDPGDALRRRYVSLIHIPGVCASKNALEKYQQAVAKLLNLLSRAAKPFRPKPIGDTGTLIGFDLAEVGWTEEDWSWLTGRFRSPPFIPVSEDAARRTGTKRPILPADWLAHEARKAVVYSRLLDLPPSLAELISHVGLDQDASARAPVYTLEKSKVTGTARTFSRFDRTDRAPLWIATDLFEPGGNHRDLEETADLRPAQHRALFQLPNGFPGFALFSRGGTRRVDIHRSVSPDQLKQAGADLPGINCIACHSEGLSAFDTAGKSQSPAPARWQIGRDRSATYVAFRAAGINPDLTIDGFEPVFALALGYERDLDLDTAAAELLLAPWELSAELLAVEGDLKPVARRLRQGLVSRQDFTTLSRRLRSSAPPTVGTSATRQAGGQSSRVAGADVPLRRGRAEEPLQLSIWTEKAGYAKGDNLDVFASATAPCRLTLISVDANGEAVVLFPSEFQPDNKLEPGRIITVPSENDGFLLKVDEPGREAIVGICLAGDRKDPPGIYHDYELQRFTLLGDWSSHLFNSLLADAAERKRVGKSHKKRSRRRRGHRRVTRLPRRDTQLPLKQDWAMIVIEASPVNSPDEEGEAGPTRGRPASQPATWNKPPSPLSTGRSTQAPPGD